MTVPNLSTGVTDYSGDNLQTMPDLRCLNRVKTEIPVVNMGCEYVMRCISRLKVSKPTYYRSTFKRTDPQGHILLVGITCILCDWVDLLWMSN